MEFPGFMAELGAAAEGSETWHRLFAGILITRVAHAALQGLELQPNGTAVLRRAFRKVPDLGERRALDAIAATARAVARAQTVPDVLGALLMSYSISLHERSHYGSAADVCTTLLDAPIGYDLRLSTLLRRAFARRLTADFGGSDADYSALVREARGVDAHMERQGRLGLAKLTIERGNIPLAVEAVEAVLADALSANDGPILGIAYIDRAALAGIQNDYRAAVRYSRCALEHLTLSWQRERCYLNMAQASREMHEPHRAAHYATQLRAAQNADVRHRAAVLRYVLTIDSGNTPGQRAAREELEAARLAPRIECDYLEAIAYELAKRRAFDDATRAVEHMVTVAEGYNLSEMVMRGDAARADLKRRRVPPFYCPSGRMVARPSAEVVSLTPAVVRHTTATAQDPPTRAGLVLAR